VNIDRFESATFDVPRTAAQKIAGGDAGQQLAAMNEGTVYVDGKVVPFDGRNAGQIPVPAPTDVSQNRLERETPPVKTPTPKTREVPPSAVTAAQPHTGPSSPLPKEALSEAALQGRQTEIQPALDRMV